VFPTAPSAVTVTLQGSNTNNDADFVDISTVTITGGKGSFSNVQTTFQFVRFNLSAITGSGTVWADINL
jgi:hypothetical protein